MDRRFVESPGFPVDVVNEASAREKAGGGRPEFWEMVFWWTRKPLASARAVVAACLLPDSVNPAEFLYMTKLRGVEGVPHRYNPSISPRYRDLFRNAKLLDPFAGFGSIPLEAIRLGVGEVVAAELLPTAYVFLKAVIEIPKWAVDNGFGKKLVEDVGRWGEWVVNRLREDRDVQELYDNETAVYIGSWEVRCPHCGRYTPLVGNWWLARASGREAESEESEEEEEESRKKSYKRIAWMESATQGNEVYIRIVDLNKVLGKKEITAKINTRQGIVEVGENRYRVPKPNIDARRETATCLHCNNQIRTVKGEWYVKTALKEWNENIEKYLTGEIPLEQLLNSKARPKLLAKVKIVGKDLEFEPATKEDNEKLWRALEKLRNIWGDPDIPTEPIPPYGNVGGGLRFPVHTTNKWYQLFNPRQLLTLVKLVKLIREAGKRVEEEKLREGWDKEKAHKYAEAVTTYLAIALVRYAGYSNIATPWKNYTGFGSSTALLRAVNIMVFRGIAMTWNWTDYNISYAGVGFERDISSLINGLSYLVSAVSGSPSPVRVLLDDATVLGKLDEEKFDLIVTDPPYRDDVAYAELSDFYYVWLRRALSDVGDVFGVVRLVPRFYGEAFFDDSGNEIDVQWRFFASKEVSEVVGRSKFFGGGVGSFNYFKELLKKSFVSMASRLSDEGVIATYYAHTTPDAWEALLEAGWLGAGLRVVVAHAIVTESAQRVTARGKASLDTSLVVVWRRGVSGEALADEVYAKAVEVCRDVAEKSRKAGYRGYELFTTVLGCVLSQFTQFKNIVGVGNLRNQGLRKLLEGYIYPATAEAIAQSLGARATGFRFSPPSMFYLLSKVLVERGRARRRQMDRSTVTIFSIGTRAELSLLESLRIVGRDGEKFYLIEPEQSTDFVKSIEGVLMDKGLSASNPNIRCSIDALHILEYLASSLKRDQFRKRFDELRTRYPQHVEEAVALAKVLLGTLPENDVEYKAARALLEALGQLPRTGLESYVGRG
ncbi:DUF1156 domain-containing protein [Ignisphaera sp. 4213-co]|uniref:DUF1156 domain-containing protein n=1 Tax=Ignisphaera cupida TaxID=3050454 RepID=A0ABD4Z6R3_9CREN|nr:DUF1156 domain-containing protein [Ignisphaera sp. 4213-co]MDK6028880.1 DUF1156 domain-containing protein [Ignisphaera sp. 4213-co]